MNEEKIKLNWYPGHMFKAKKEIMDAINMVDVVVELLDARIPFSSQNPSIQEITKNKKKIVILNKSDLAEKEENIKWKKYLEENKNLKVNILNSETGEGIKEFYTTLNNLLKEKIDNQKNKGILKPSIKILIVGIPNVGKSSFINKIVDSKKALTGNKPGVTKKQSWIKGKENIAILDTPGILWPRFEEYIGVNLAICGNIKDEIFDEDFIAYEILKKMISINKIQNVISRYKIDEKVDKKNKFASAEEEREYILNIMEQIAIKRGFIQSGNNIDYARLNKNIIQEFRNLKFGQITLEKIENER